MNIVNASQFFLLTFLNKFFFLQVLLYLIELLLKIFRFSLSFFPNLFHKSMQLTDLTECLPKQTSQILAPVQQYLGKISQPCLFHLYLKILPCLLIFSKHFFSWSKVNHFLRKRKPGVRFPLAEKLKRIFFSVTVLGEISPEALRVQLVQKILLNGVNMFI